MVTAVFVACVLGPVAGLGLAGALESTTSLPCCVPSRFRNGESYRLPFPVSNAQPYKLILKCLTAFLRWGGIRLVGFGWIQFISHSFTTINRISNSIATSGHENKSHQARAPA